MTNYTDIVPDAMILECVRPMKEWEVACIKISSDGRVSVEKETRKFGIGGTPKTDGVQSFPFATSTHGRVKICMESLKADLDEGGELAELIDRVKAGTFGFDEHLRGYLSWDVIPAFRYIKYDTESEKWMGERLVFVERERLEQARVIEKAERTIAHLREELEFLRSRTQSEAQP